MILYSFNIMGKSRNRTTLYRISRNVLKALKKYGRSERNSRDKFILYRRYIFAGPIIL